MYLIKPNLVDEWKKCGVDFSDDDTRWVGQLVRFVDTQTDKRLVICRAIDTYLNLPIKAIMLYPPELEDLKELAMEAYNTDLFYETAFTCTICRHQYVNANFRDEFVQDFCFYCGADKRRKENRRKRQRELLKLNALHSWLKKV